MKLSAFCFLVACLQWATANVVQEKTNLINHLLTDYNVDVEPENAIVKFNLGLICAMYDREDGVMKTSAWERYQWTDSRLAWTPSEHGNIETVRISHESIWLPDFKLQNFVSPKDMRQSSKAVVSHTGKIIWVPAVQYKTLCSHDNRTLHCDYKIGPWSEDSNTISIGEWEGLSKLTSYENMTCPLLATINSVHVVSRHYPCCTEPYSIIDISVTYQKNQQVHFSRHHEQHSRGKDGNDDDDHDDYDD